MALDRLITILLLVPLCLNAAIYKGRVVDEAGQPVPFATVYVQDKPEDGTATNQDGWFTLETQTSTDAPVVISFVGYQKQFMPLKELADSTHIKTVVLKEQPIALEETVVEAKRTRKSKRKMLAQILRATYNKLVQEQPLNPVSYGVVSDVQLDAQSATWGMEQMIATVIEQANIGSEGADSVQFIGLSCKRYCPAQVREQLDSLFRHEKDTNMMRMASALDSGTVVHRALWKMRLQKDHLLDTSDELRRWQMSSEDNTRCVLTYTRKHNYIGILKTLWKENLIVDAYDFGLQSYTIEAHVSLFLPFSIRLKGTQLEWLNLFNIGNETLEKFRLKRGEMSLRISTLYRPQDGVRVPYEKNLMANGYVEDRKKKRIPIEVRATQQVTALQTQDVQLLPKYSKRAVVPRTIVPIY
ncbi:MAG: carboxypeptidase-like regulatory domain-containing protein [Paludibacteraceae bacterium]|nr:carboxypeptidase-like regulatory domain-containing protein [Paludibacteraceae bacterium]